MNDERKYPIGEFKMPDSVTVNDLVQYIHDIEALPTKLTELCKGLPDKEYDNLYRPGSWNVRQLLIHITDSHAHSYIRFKWTLTENTPKIKAYDEETWAELEDGLNTPICEILEEIKITQRRLGRVIRSLKEQDLSKSFIHPETNSKFNLGQLTAMYAWHGNHHFEHLKLAVNNPFRG